MTVRRVRKALVPFFTGVISLVGLAFGEQYVNWITPEIIIGLAGLVSSGVVWLVPNDMS